MSRVPKPWKSKAWAASNEPDSASLLTMEVAFLPRTGRSVTGDVATGTFSRRTSRGGWGQRTLKVKTGT
jgi:hypothetical protein